MQKQLLIITIFLLAYLPTHAEPGYTGEDAIATRIQERIKIDGVLDEEAWLKGNPVTGFIQFTPNEGEPASEPTKVTVLYDDAAVYVGFMCYESEPEKMVKILS
ncbi:MAG: hypothetical protein JSW64_11085, partial [Candidatus Zixiibacteriota bacterium]